MTSRTTKALMIIVSFMVTRAFIYAKMPVTTYAEWFWRDTVMTLPRIAAFLASLQVLNEIPGTSWLKIKSPASVIVLLGILFTEAFAISSLRWILPFTSPVAKLGWATTLAVAFFEETCFRGVLFQDLKENMTPLKAAIISTLIFTIFHVQAQSIVNWPGIFLVGFSLCAAYYRGAGLIWLVVAHELIDGPYMHVGDMQRPYLFIIAYIPLALTAVYSASLLRKPFPPVAEVVN